MNKELLIRYIRGHCTPTESRQVLDWAGRSDENRQYLIRLMNLWVSQNMPQQEASEKEMARMREMISSRGPRPKKRGVTLPRAAVWIGAACLVAIGAFGFWAAATLRPQPDAIAVYDPIRPDADRMFYTNNGVKGSVVLPDSSVVWLNSGSKLWYPENFGTDKREVKLSGEGYFEVTHDPQRPMIVSTPKNFRVEVLGTTFNLKSYEDDDVAVATLYSGCVNIVMDGASQDGRLVTKLQPNECITIYGDNTTRRASISTPSENSDWKEGRMIFDSTPLNEVIRTLERWHGVDFVVEDKEVLGYRITAQFSSESIVQVMDLIRMTSFVDYRIDGRKVFLKKR